MLVKDQLENFSASSPVCYWWWFEDCLISPSHVSKQNITLFVMIIGTPPKSLQKRSNKMREEKGKEVEKGERIED